MEVWDPRKDVQDDEEFYFDDGNEADGCDEVDVLVWYSQLVD